MATEPGMAPWPPPWRATYRLQLRGDLHFAGITALLPYLARLGVSQLYLSPIWQAAPGSTHGYDVVDAKLVDPVLGGPAGLLAFVVSGAQAWVDRGSDATIAATLAQARHALGTSAAALTPMQLVTEKRATFRCTPLLERPPMRVAPGLLAAGDYVDGPYPATLEGAVRAGVAAAHAIG